MKNKTPKVSLRTLQRERAKNKILEWKLFNEKARADSWFYEYQQLLDKLDHARKKIAEEMTYCIICLFCAILLFVGGLIIGGLR